MTRSGTSRPYTWTEGLASVLPGQRQHVGASVGEAGGAGAAGWVVEGAGTRPQNWEGGPGLPVCTAGGQVRPGLRPASLPGRGAARGHCFPQGERGGALFLFSHGGEVSLSSLRAVRVLAQLTLPHALSQTCPSTFGPVWWRGTLRSGGGALTQVTWSGRAEPEPAAPVLGWVVRKLSTLQASGPTSPCRHGPCDPGVQCLAKLTPRAGQGRPRPPASCQVRSADPPTPVTSQHLKTGTVFSSASCL